MKPSIFIFAAMLATCGGWSGIARAQTGPGAGTTIPNPSSGDVTTNCTQAPTNSGCPGTGARAMPNTSNKKPGNTEFLTSPTGMMTDTGAQPPANDGHGNNSESEQNRQGESRSPGASQPSSATDRATLPPISTSRTPPPK